MKLRPAKLTTALWFAGCVFLGGCAGCEEPVESTPSDPHADPPLDPVVADAPPSPCELGEPVDILRARSRGGLAMRGGWTAALDDVLTVGHRDGRSERVGVSEARHLLWLEDIGGPLVLAAGSCAEAAHCLLALDPTRGEPPLRVPLPSAIVTSRRAATDTRAYFAWSGDAGTRGIERFSRDDTGAIVHRTLPLGEEEPSAEAPTEILGLTARDERYAVVWRRGATEDSRSRVYLSTARAQRPIEALHEALVIEAIDFDGPHVAVVAGFELARPGYARLVDGAPELRPLGPEDEVPAPLGGRVRGSLEIDDEGLWLRRQNASGDTLGVPVRVLEERVEMAAVTREERQGGEFFVGWAIRDRVRARTVRCEDAPR